MICRFANDACGGTNNMNGTCYTEAECSSRGGTNGGTCASGFGVCCLSMTLKIFSNKVNYNSMLNPNFAVTLNCGGMTNENCTYFNSETIQAGSCKATVCPCNDNICQVTSTELFFSISRSSTLMYFPPPS